MKTLIETEKAILGSIIVRSENIVKVSTRITEDYFTDERHKHIFQTIKAMFTKDIAVDMLTLSNKLEELKQLDKIGGRSFIAGLCESTPMSTNIDYYLDILEKSHTKNKLIELSKEVKKYGEEESDLDIKEILALIQTKLLTLSSTDQEENLNSQIEKLKQVQKEYKEKPAGSLIGISTGYPKLDSIIDGFRKGHFWVLGGYTSAGKTFASLNLVANLIKQKKRVVFYSLEMTEVDIISRLVGILTSQNTKVILRGEQSKDINEALELIKESNFEIITSKREILDIQFSMFEKMARSPVDLFVLDFIQLVHVKSSKSDYERLTVIAHKLQDIAKMLSTTILALSQISNESAKIQSEDISGFKGSGDIEAAADLALKLKHGENDTTEYKKKLVHVNKNKGLIPKIEMPIVFWGIHKNRHGEGGKIDMRFNGYTGQFLQDVLDDF